MELGSILLFLALLLLVGAYIARPIFEQRAVGVTALDQHISTLLAERDRILDALQELDFDNQMGKIPAGEYPAQRSRLLQKGASVLKELDSLQGTTAQLQEEPLLNNNGRRHLKAPDDDLETLIAQRRRVRKEKSAGFCAQCGHAIQASDKFCAKCGNTIN